MVGYISLDGTNGTMQTFLYSVVGVLLSILWFRIIVSYGQLNAAKFDLIHAMEEKLPIQMYKEEYELLNDKPGLRYSKLSAMSLANAARLSRHAVSAAFGCDMIWPVSKTA